MLGFLDQLYSTDLHHLREIELQTNLTFVSGNPPFAIEEMKASEKFIGSPNILQCPLADRNETGRIAYCFMHTCIRKVIWLSMKDRVPSGRGGIQAHGDSANNL